MFEWPKKIWIVLKSAPLVSKCVAKECLIVCGDTFFSICATEQ
jgi:hypothetical protein